MRLLVKLIVWTFVTIYSEARLEPLLLSVAMMGSAFVHSALFLIMLVAHVFGFDPTAFLRDDALLEVSDSVGIVPARLVRLGEQPEPDKLPDRIVPALPTAPDDGIPVAKKIDPPPPKRTKAKRRPLNPVEDDKVRDVLSRIRAFGEVTDHVTSMGHPTGVPGGDVSDPSLAQAGSLWARQVSRVIKSYITFPTIIAQDELKRLKCKVEVKVGRDLIPQEAKLAKRGTSRNQFFDQSVLDSFEQMRIKRVKLPRPPNELEDALFSSGLILKIYGRDLD